MVDPLFNLLSAGLEAALNRTAIPLVLAFLR